MAPLGDPIDNPASFKAEARYQGFCAISECGTANGPWHAHHVLHEQETARLGLPVYDTRNALRLCTGGYIMGGCHGRHHGKQRKVKVKELTNDNIIFVVEALGERAEDWLDRYYDLTTPDPRLTEAMQGRAA